MKIQLEVVPTSLLMQIGGVVDSWSVYYAARDGCWSVSVAPAEEGLSKVQMALAYPYTCGMCSRGQQDSVSFAVKRILKAVADFEGPPAHEPVAPRTYLPDAEA